MTSIYPATAQNCPLLRFPALSGGVFAFSILGRKGLIEKEVSVRDCFGQTACPVQRLPSFRLGDRAEYLAQYILSGIAISVPVLRQEDVGTDFHCSLCKTEGNAIRPYLPFNIQVKRSGSPLLFGGVTNGGAWREHEIDWLCESTTPFLIGLVDGKEKTLSLYSTINRVFAKYGWQGKGKFRSVELVPDEPLEGCDLGQGEPVSEPQCSGMPSWSLRLPIGQPIVRIHVSNAENAEKNEAVRSLLEPFLLMDQRNFVFASAFMGYFEWPVKISPGERLSVGGVAIGAYVADAAITEQLQTVRRAVASLLRGYQSRGEKDLIRAWEFVIPQLSKDYVERVNDVISEAVEFAR